MNTSTLSMRASHALLIPATMAAAGYVTLTRGAVDESRFNPPAFENHYLVATLDATPVYNEVQERTYSPPPYAETWQRIRSFKDKPEGWKGPGSIPVSQQAIDAAEQFTLATVTAGVTQPSFVGAAADGELIINWRAPDLFVEASFDETGTFSYYAKVGTTEYFGDDVKPFDGLPQNVLTTLMTG